MEKEKATERIHIKVQPSLKELAQARADQDGRSLSNYILNLIKKDLEEAK